MDKPTRIMLISLVIMIMPNVSVSESRKSNVSLREMYSEAKRANRDRVYHQPEQEELKAFRTLWEMILGTANLSDAATYKSLDKTALEIGFQIQSPDANRKRKYFVIREIPGCVQGSGFYSIKVKPDGVRPSIIQAPHAQSDSGTGDIALAVYLHTAAIAFFSSTVQRDASTLNQLYESNSCPSDVAHSENSFFQTATEYFTTRNPDLLLIQIHGFDSEKLSSVNRKFDMIISSGSENCKNPLLWDKFQSIFSRILWEKRIAFFGLHTEDLGAVTNIQGKHIRETASGEFLHIELEKSYRINLQKDERQMNQFIDCISQVISAYETF